MVCLFIISLILAVCNARLSLKGGAANAFINNHVPIIQKLNFPIDTNGRNPGNRPLVAKSSSDPDTYTKAMVRALAFMAEGNVVLEQDDNSTPNNPFDDSFVMISARGERVNLSYGEIVKIRDVNHRLNSIFETTPGSITPAITTVIQGAQQGSQRTISANSRSASFNLGQSRSSNSGGGTVEIGYIPSRKIAQTLSSNNFAGSRQLELGSAGRGRGGVGGIGRGDVGDIGRGGVGGIGRGDVGDISWGGANDIGRGGVGGIGRGDVGGISWGGANDIGRGGVGGLNTFHRQQKQHHLYKMQMQRRLQAMRYGILSRMFLRPTIHPMFFRRFPF